MVHQRTRYRHSRAMNIVANSGVTPPFPRRVMPRKLGAFFATAHEGAKAPWEVQRLIDQEGRRLSALRLKREGHLNRYERAELQASFEAELGDMNARREAEHALADYIESISEEFSNIVARLRGCRMSGFVGRKPDGDFFVAFDEKCSLVRLCPDEARAETMRVVRKYVPAIRRWVSRKRGRRVYSAVFTIPNARPGELEAAKLRLFELFKDLLRYQYDACPLIRGPSGFERTRRRRLAAFPQICGALVVQEDPLSASDDFNVHLNVFLLTDGWLDYREVRELWRYNLHIEQIDSKNLIRSVLELVKYATQIVPTKSAEKRARHSSDAPAMTEWPPERWVEWWKAQKGFRRTRSYGCLYALDEMRWNDMPLVGPRPARLDSCVKADVPTTAITTRWRQLDQAHGAGTRNKLGAAWEAEEGEKFDINQVTWLGPIRFVPGDGYRVDLILEDNFGSSASDSVDYRTINNNLSRGPPLN